jgi:hypothetical protein
VADGDCVVTTPMSFVASANAIPYERGIPVFADVDPVTLTLDPARTLEAMDAIAHRRAGWRVPPAALRGASTAQIVCRPAARRLRCYPVEPGRRRCANLIPS